MTSRLGIGVRLKEERERLKLGQPAVTRLTGAAKKTQYNYENGVSAPDAEFLAALSTAGMDVFYVLTGQRSAIALAPDESVLVEGYRKLDGRGKAGLLAYLAGANSTDTVRATFNGSVGTAINGDMHIGNFKGKIGG